MYQALQLKQPEGVHIPGERTVYRVMAEIGLNHKPKRKPNAITKAVRPDTYGFFHKCHCIHLRCKYQALHLPVPDISKGYLLLLGIC